LSIKTGATEAFDKLPTQLLTILQCADTLLLFSDLEQDIHSLHIHDVLSRYDPEFLEHHADFELYRKQKEYQTEGRDIQTLSTMTDSNSDWRTSGHNAAWALDKYKFLHMIERAWELQPDKEWYVFAETDTYIVWRNLVQWLQNFDSTEPLYLGRGEPMKKEEGDGFFFMVAAALCCRVLPCTNFASPRRVSQVDGTLGYPIYGSAIMLSPKLSKRSLISI
jgi:hypothetical protein